MSCASHPPSLCGSTRQTSGSLALGFLVLPLKSAMICLICSRFMIGVVSEDIAPPCSAVAAIVFRLVLPCCSFSSDPLGAGGSGVVGLGALCSVKALSSHSPSHERSRFSDRGSMWFSLLVSVLSVC